MQATASAHDLHQDRHPETRRENSIRSSRLDERYGQIGIPAVAAAVRCKTEQRKTRTRHTPLDRD